MSKRTTPGSDDAALEQRLKYAVEEINDFIAEYGDYRTNVLSVVATPKILDRNRRVGYTMRVTGDPVPGGWVEQMHNIISRARSILDNLMWHAAHASGTTFNSKQKDRIKFPVAVNAADWTAFESSAHGAALDSNKREALRHIQPFSSGRKTISWLSKANNDDKHKYPLSLQIMPDRLFVFYPDVDFGKRGRGETRFELAEPLLPVGNRFLGYFYSEHPVTAARPFDVPTALCIKIYDEWVDVQDFLWDVLELVVRASEILSDGGDGVADAIKRYIESQRAQLDAFRRIFEGDPVAEAVWRSMTQTWNP